MIHQQKNYFLIPCHVPATCAMYRTGTVLGIGVTVMNKTDEVLSLVEPVVGRDRDNIQVDK